MTNCFENDFWNTTINEYKNLRSSSKIKHCLHPNHEECRGKIKNAHSIQNNKILNKIATNGEVIMFLMNPHKKLEMFTKWGRRKATTFTGFCDYHDTEIFREIENKNFDKNNNYHIFLYTYRCWAFEYHQALEKLKFYQEAAKKDSSLLFKNDYIMRKNGLQHFVKALEAPKTTFDSGLLNNTYDVLISVVWEFDCEIKFAGSGCETTEFDLNGKQIQNLEYIVPFPQQIFYIIFPENGKTYCIISWFKKADNLFDDFYTQLNKLSVKKRKIYINNLVSVMKENLVINPDAWEKWNNNEKSSFINFNIHCIDNRENRLKKQNFDLFNL